MLYIGLVFEKGRCGNHKIWKHSYSQSLRKHIKLLKKITECMQKPFQIEEDNIFLKNICYEILNDVNLEKHYPFCNVTDIINSEKIIITECRDENSYEEIIQLINQLLEDILLELNKGLKKDKEKIVRMIFSLHNLPRVYLKKGINTLCLLGQHGINPKEALAYSKLSMNEEMVSNYSCFFIYG